MSMLIGRTTVDPGSDALNQAFIMRSTVAPPTHISSSMGSLGRWCRV
jgi:hypothetical protein